ncbi:MAG: hypothetical protein O3B65_01790 [Chloroflexi bacterium]|nr:hypothetical protein [Chloroflexota bacterium]
METVYHIAHVNAAQGIVSDRTIRAGLIADESILRKSRILVAWLSPNDWYQGSIYGTVRFSVPFNNLWNSRRAYWVEVKRDHNPTSVRILITDQNRDQHARLIPYDPTAGDGPWWYDSVNNVHYRNGDVTLDFLYEGGLSVEDSTAVDLVAHNETLCAEDWAKCQDKNIPPKQAGARLIARLVSSETSCLPLRWDEAEESLIASWKHMKQTLAKHASDATFTGSQLGNAERNALARALLGAYARKNTQELAALTGLFDTDEGAISSCRQLVSDAFGVTPP